MNVSGEPITRCPVCRYDLTGLPKNHKCPECGFEYNEAMRIWYLQRPSKAVLVFTFFSLAVLPFAMMSFAWFEKTGSFIVPRSVFFRLASVALPVSLLLPLMLSIPLIIMKRRQPFVIVADESLHVRWFKTIHQYPWKNLTLRGSYVARWAKQNSTGHFACETPSRWIRFWGNLGDWYSFRIVMKRQGNSEGTIQLPVRRGDLHREVFNRWLEAQVGQ